jgi:hypothetical protein
MVSQVSLASSKAGTYLDAAVGLAPTWAKLDDSITTPVPEGCIYSDIVSRASPRPGA